MVGCESSKLHAKNVLSDVVNMPAEIVIYEPESQVDKDPDLLCDLALQKVTYLFFIGLLVLSSI